MDKGSSAMSSTTTTTSTLKTPTMADGETFCAHTAAAANTHIYYYATLAHTLLIFPAIKFIFLRPPLPSASAASSVCHRRRRCSSHTPYCERGWICQRRNALPTNIVNNLIKNTFCWAAMSWLPSISAKPYIFQRRGKFNGTQALGRCGKMANF